MQCFAVISAQYAKNEKSLNRLEKLIEGIGSGDRNRTCDTGLMSPLLYRLSYAAIDLALCDYLIIGCQDPGNLQIDRIVLRDG